MPAKRETYLRWLKKRISQCNSRCKRLGVEGRIEIDALRRENGVVLFAPEGPVYFECYWCRQAILEPRKLSLDHVCPLSRGGRNVETNVRITHRACNLLRSDWDAGQWGLFVKTLVSLELFEEFKKRFRPRRFRRT